jgi:hypothetical protein
MAATVVSVERWIIRLRAIYGAACALMLERKGHGCGESTPPDMDSYGEVNFYCVKVRVLRV